MLDMTSRFRWIKRLKDFSNFKSSDANEIKREYWMKGEIVNVINDINSGDLQSIQVKISFRDDIDYSWRAQYKGVNVIISQRNTCSNNYENPHHSFSDWVQNNFDVATVVISSDDESVVVCEYFNVASAAHEQRQDLLSWAKANLRAFDFSLWHDDLFAISPRALKSEVEKANLFQLSHGVTEIKFEWQKIDFFCSHSWEDDSSAVVSAKCKLLRDFSKTKLDASGRLCSRWRRQPTYWLDKVCIDQRDTSRGVAVLPINVGACKKMLIILSSTYFRRLWCVWELFTLFTFCNKEMAMERIEILPLESVDNETTSSPEVSCFDPSQEFRQSLHNVGEVDNSILNQLKSFDIDNAHCFDPNEEFKLRQIINDMGIDFTQCLELIARELKKKAL